MAKKDALVTREYFDEQLEAFKETILGSVKNELAQLKDDIFGRIDRKEDDDDVHSFSHQRINDELSEHEARLKSVEAVSKS